MREINPYGNKPYRGARQPKVTVLPLSAEENVCPPNEVQWKEDDNDRHNASKPNEWFTRNRHQPVLLRYCPA
jgi:hypothetical protein